MSTLVRLIFIFAVAIRALATRVGGAAAPAPAADAAASGDGSFDDLIAAVPFVCQSFVRSAAVLPGLTCGYPPKCGTIYYDGPVEIDLLLWAPLLHTLSLCVARLPLDDKDGTAERVDGGGGGGGGGLAPHSLKGAAGFKGRRLCGTGLRPFFGFMHADFMEDAACVRRITLDSLRNVGDRGKWKLPPLVNTWKIDHVVASARLRIAPPLLHRFGGRGSGGDGGGGDDTRGRAPPPLLLVITTPGLRPDEEADGGGRGDADEFCPRQWATCLTPDAIRAVALAAAQSGGRWRILLWPTVLPQ